MTRSVETTLRRRRAHPIVGHQYWITLKPEHGGCWIWNGALDRDGYGRTVYGFKQAHRVMYEEQVGPIPEGMEIDHLCNVRSCVNPEHLEAVTRGENERRKNERRREPGKCINGHELAETQRWRKNNPQRWWCTSCEQERSQRRRASVA